MSIDTDKKGVNSPLDNSNPQQGTFSLPSVHNEKRVNRKDSTDVEMNILKSTTEDGKKPLTQKNSTESIQHVKVPPTKKDSRKLFVGGLPSNGKFYLCCILYFSMILKISVWWDSQFFSHKFISLLLF